MVEIPKETTGCNRSESVISARHGRTVAVFRDAEVRVVQSS
jgi:hypothetical protein